MVPAAMHEAGDRHAVRSPVGLTACLLCSAVRNRDDGMGRLLRAEYVWADQGSVPYRTTSQCPSSRSGAFVPPAPFELAERSVIDDAAATQV